MSDAPRDTAGSLAAEVSGRLRDRYEQASFGGDEAALAEGLTEVAALRGVLDLAHGRLLHTQFLQDRRDLGLGELGRLRTGGRHVPGSAGMAASGEAEALFWIGAYHQVVHGDSETALPSFVRQPESSRRQQVTS